MLAVSDKEEKSDLKREILNREFAWARKSWWCTWLDKPRHG